MDSGIEHSGIDEKNTFKEIGRQRDEEEANVEEKSGYCHDTCGVQEAFHDEEKENPHRNVCCLCQSVEP